MFNYIVESSIITMSRCQPKSRHEFFLPDNDKREEEEREEITLFIDHIASMHWMNAPVLYRCHVINPYTSDTLLSDWCVQCCDVAMVAWLHLIRSRSETWQSGRIRTVSHRIATVAKAMSPRLSPDSNAEWHSRECYRICTWLVMRYRVVTPTHPLPPDG